jgi:hypothetical protein
VRAAPGDLLTSAFDSAGVIGGNENMSNPLTLRVKSFKLSGPPAWLGLGLAFGALGCGDSAKGIDSPTSAGTRANRGGATARGGSTSVGGTSPATGGTSLGSGGSSTGEVATGGKATGGGATGGSSSGGAPVGGSAPGGPVTTGGTNAGGTTAGGSQALGGTQSPGGTSSGGTSAGGRATGGGKATGGRAAGGTAVGGGASTGGAATGGSGEPVAACGSTVSVNRDPFNCNFGWGSSNSSATSYLNFQTAWIGYETNGGLDSWSATATNNSCNGCTVARNLASSSAIPAFYAYTIAYQACAKNSYCDCNTDASGNLCTNGADWIRTNYAIIVRAYAEYARAVNTAAPSKAALWLLEGDLSQYSNNSGQAGGPLTWAELGQLVSDVTCAIKTNHPNAAVYVNHSFWLDTSTTTSMFNAMPLSILDGLWMGGSPNASCLIPSSSGTCSSSAVTYSFLHTLTGLPLYVGGQGASQPNWVSATAADLDARISEGVIAADIDPLPSGAQTTISSLTLTSTCL